MTKSLKGLLCAALAMFCSIAFADDHAYTDGPVTTVSAIRTQPGQFDAYLKYLSATYKKIMEEQKKAGLIVDWKVFQAFPRNPNEPDLFLTITYKNWGAFDGLQEKMDPIQKQVFGSLDQANAASVDRGKLRTQLGTENIQELILK